jgi:spermidine synthase
MVRAVALFLTLLTGFSGLVYEVTWQKYFATLLGSHSEATAAVLGIFLGGLSVGYAVFGTVTRRLVERGIQEGKPPRLLLVYGLVESAIGLYALAFPLIFQLAMAVSTRIPHGGGTLGFAFDVVLTIFLIGPPTVLMGGTIPVLTQALSRSLADATRFHALVYAFNTIGAFAGALAAGFVLVPLLGFAGVMSAMGAINLLAGGTFLVLGRRAQNVRAVAPPPRSAAVAEVRGFVFFAATALLAGFAMMAIQTILIRLGVLSFGASQFTFSMVVAVFVLCIALGSFAVSALPRIPTGTVVLAQWALIVLLAALYGQLQNAPYYAHALRATFHSTSAAFYPYYISAFVLMLLVLALPIGISGALLPLLFHELRHEAADLGHVAGRLYSWNTVGSLLGALIGGYLLLFWLDLHHVYRIALIALGLGACLLAGRLLRPAGLMASVVALALLLAFVWSAAPWEGKRLSSGLFRERAPMPENVSFRGPNVLFPALRSESEMLFYDDDPTSTVSVVKSNVGSLSLMTNGKPDTAVPLELPTVVGLALIPCLLAERCESAFVVGLGTGVTAGELGMLETIQRVVVSEISPGVREAVTLFSSANQDVAHNPKVEIRPGDAYRALSRDDGRYDVIVSEPSNPWVAGVENLYSQEFLTAAKERLNPGGVYAQWFHLYEASDEVIQIVLRTFSSVFDQVAVWHGMGPDLILIGWNGRAEGSLDIARLEQRAALPSVAAALRRGGWDSVPALLAHEILPLGMANASLKPGPLQTLYRPILNNRAARDFFVGDTSVLSPSPKLEAGRIGVRNSLLRRYTQRHGGQLTDDDWAQVIGHACKARPQSCAPLLASWTLQDPGSRDLQTVVEQLIRKEITTQEVQDRLSLLLTERHESDPMPTAEVEKFADTFLQFYDPAVPLRRRSLGNMISRCRDDAKGRCEVLAGLVAEMIGRLDIEPEDAVAPGSH